MIRISLAIVIILSFPAFAAAESFAAPDDPVEISVYTEQQYRGILTLLDNFRDKALRIDQAEGKLAARLKELKVASKNVVRLPGYFGGREIYIEARTRPAIRKVADDLKETLECVRSVQPRGDGGYIIPAGCFDYASFSQAETLRKASRLWNNQPLNRAYLLAVLPDSYTVSIPDGQVVRCSASRPPCRQHLAVILQSLVDDWQKIKIEFSSPVATPGEPRVSSRGPTIQ